MNKVFIFTNVKQMVGAKVAKFALQKHPKNPESFSVEIVEVEKIPAFQKFAGTEYLFGRDGSRRTYTLEDLQSFTLSRFMPPALMDYEGRAIGIDPDIFALSDVTELFSYDLKSHAVAACKKKNAWDSSVMLMDNEKLTDWNIDHMLSQIATGKKSYMEIMTLEGGDVLELPRLWNSLDVLSPETKMLHTTGRLTQPWKTGLPIDFTRNTLPKYFGIIPREPILRLFGKYPSRYQPHPDKNIEKFFFALLKEAIAAGALSREELKTSILEGNIRKDAFTLLGGEL